MDQDLEVLDAFFDGERVDRDALKRALADPAGRDYLVDLLELREIAGAMELRSAVTAHRPRRVSLARWAAVAALVVCSLGAYAVGHYSGRWSAPLPASAAAGVTRNAPNDSQRSAPAPTHIIRLQPGLDWTESSGGN